MHLMSFCYFCWSTNLGNAAMSAMLQQEQLRATRQASAADSMDVMEDKYTAFGCSSSIF